MWLDRNLSRDKHITKTCSAAFYCLYNIRRIRPYLSRQATEITSRLDYCNSLFYGIPSYQLQKLQRIQNAAARLIFGKSKFCHITPLLKSLHWLPVKQRVKFKILLLTFKAIHCCSPQYITVREPIKYSLRSQATIEREQPKGKFLATLGDRSFTAAAPKLWNNLPSEIRNLKTINSFKLSLKTSF